MPMGPYEDFDACVRDQMDRGNDEESARRICGALKRDVEAGFPNARSPFADEAASFEDQYRRLCGDD